MAVLEQSWIKVQEKTFGKWYGGENGVYIVVVKDCTDAIAG